jgi:hypothetical protein
MDLSGFEVKEIYAVYNSMLVSSFALTYAKFERRAQTSAELFLKEKWRDMDQSPTQLAAREWTKEVFNKKASEYNWNQFSSTPIIPTIHGTSEHAAWKIAASGFAALSSLDSGYYGAGRLLLPFPSFPYLPYSPE